MNVNDTKTAERMMNGRRAWANTMSGSVTWCVLVRRGGVPRLDHRGGHPANSVSGEGDVRERIVGHRQELQDAEDKAQKHFFLVRGDHGEHEKEDHRQGGEVPGLVEHLFELLHRAHQKERTADRHHVAWQRSKTKSAKSVTRFDCQRPTERVQDCEFVDASYDGHHEHGDLSEEIKGVQAKVFSEGARCVTHTPTADKRKPSTKQIAKP